MSIRLRLTLLYSGILALTLVLFSVGVYGLQARTGLQEIEEKLAATGRILNLMERPSLPPDGIPLPKIPRERFPSQPYWSVRATDGTVLRSDPNLDNVALPLTDAARQNILLGDGISQEIDTIGDERFLIYSRRWQVSGGHKVIVQVGVSLAEYDRSLRRLARMLAMGSGVIVLLAFGVGWWLAGYTLRPIDRLTHTARAIGEAQDFSRRVDYDGPPDEIGRLATTFNLMLERLQTAFRQVAEALGRQKQFVADASHELRTPLTTIRGNLGLLQRQPPPDANEQADIVNDMVAETERLMRLVHNLLALARTDAGHALPLAPISVTDVMADVCRQAQILSPEREIICHSEPALTAQGNRDALKQVLLALVDNALNHTDPTAEISLSATQVDDHIRITMHDTGAGMPPAQAAHIFERFYRGDAARTGGGAGLGLSIAQSLMRAQRGDIVVQSVLGEGTTFVVTLPSSA